MLSAKRAETVSIIMPAYNAAEYLDFSIKSVLAQRFPRWELIIVDDGSTDNTFDVVQKWQSQDKRIRYIKQENSGVSVARNRALDIARGEYITMLDADDAIHADTLELMYQAMTKEAGINMVTVGFREITPPDMKIVSRGGLLMGRTDSGTFFSADGFIAEYIHCSVWGKLLRSDIIRRNNIRFHPDLAICEDHHFMLNYLQYAGKVAVLQNELYDYMQWQGSAISRFDAGILPDSVYINAVTVYETLLIPGNKKWNAAMLSHFLRVYKWVQRIILTHKPADWSHIRTQIIKKLPLVLYRAGIIESLRMLRRWRLI